MYPASRGQQTGGPSNRVCDGGGGVNYYNHEHNLAAHNYYVLVLEELTEKVSLRPTILCGGQTSSLLLRSTIYSHQHSCFSYREQCSEEHAHTQTGREVHAD